MPPTAEEIRLEQSRTREAHWKRWGPYLSERQWGTVREDYSADGEAWNYFPFEHSHLRAYRWGEDGIAGISDRRQFVCFSVALWNGRDPILKERLFGLGGKEGNHGEDVKECYFYLDSTPTHSYMKYLYKYPQAEFPYERLRREARRRNKRDPEPEIWQTGAFENGRYFDVFVEYAKQNHETILVRIRAVNRGPEPAEIHLLPTVWFRNTWSWTRDAARPQLCWRGPDIADAETVEIEHDYYDRRRLICEGTPTILFTENETNRLKLYTAPNRTPFVKDAFHDYVIRGDESAVNPRQRGTKAAALYKKTLAPGETYEVRLRLTDHAPGDAFEDRFEQTFADRIREADEFYQELLGRCSHSSDGAKVQRQAFAGLLWTKQFYHYDVARWIDGDPAQPKPPAGRKPRNADWRHLYNDDIISMPDKWEYPWYAAWDSAFHCVPLALADPDFAKEQLVLLLREWYMHPNGQIPAYEWKLSDVNPPVHAWACWRVYKIEGRVRGVHDRNFLERVFHKLLLNFTWWVNRKDPDGRNVFQGGFLGLDNIGVFDRSNIPPGLKLEQSDSTSWMAMYCLNMLAIALELAKENRAYSDVATKFFEHFVYIVDAMHGFGRDQAELWDESDGFYYDVLHRGASDYEKLKVRSLVGLIPLFAVLTLEPEVVDALPGFKRRLEWFIENRPWFRTHVTTTRRADGATRRLLSLVNPERLPRVLRLMLDEEEFLSPYGVRSLSKFHQRYPYEIEIRGRTYRVEYEPAESRTYLFGGNSNWRGPVWFPVNYLLIESLQRFHYYLGDNWLVEHPTGSGEMRNLWEVSEDLSRRLNRLFLPDEDGRRPVYGGEEIFQDDPHWRDYVLFYEYFHGDNGAGLGASHQTGWTGLVAKLLEQSGE